MNQGTKETRPTAATVRRAMEPGANREESPESTSKFTTAAASRQTGIASLLLHGPENGLTIRHLEKITGLDSRTIRGRIEAERRSGALIISDCRNGYYLTDDPAEAQRFARSMTHRAREILKTARAIEGAAGCD